MEGSRAFRYRAFISYSHADEIWATWLHRRLERYRVPSRLVGKAGPHGNVPRRIGRCFRDQAELSAASHLGETLQQALRESQALIIICSPRSAASRWVNEEIKYFRSLGRGGHVYALIVDGEPNARDRAQECFPPALLRDDDGTTHEPLAADAREGRDGKSDGFLKLAAGLLGVGFDELRRRELRRRQRVMFVTVAAALAIAAITTGLAIGAYRARNEAQHRREQADDLINFMLGDLKERLEPVGRLDVLDAVTSKLMGYLAEGELVQLDDATLAQRVRAQASVASIRATRAQMPQALDAAERAVAAAQLLVTRKPKNTDVQYLLALALEAQASPMTALGNGEGARAPIAEAQQIVNALLETSTADPELIYLRETLRADAANILGRQIEWNKLTAGEYARCADGLRPLALEAEAKAKYVRAYLNCKAHWALALFDGLQLQDAAKAYQELLAEAPRLLEHREDDTTLLQPLVDIAENASLAVQTIGQLDLAASASRQALDYGHQLVAHDPTNANWQSSLAGALLSEWYLQRTRNDWIAARSAASEEVELEAALLRRNPRDTTIRMALMKVYWRLAVSLHELRDDAAALADLDGAIVVGSPDQAPAIRSFTLFVQLYLWQWASDREPTRAVAARTTALQLFQDLSALRENLPPDWSDELKFEQMHIAYLNEDVTGGDRLYREMLNPGLPPTNNLTRTRKHLCAWLAARGPRRCGETQQQPTGAALARSSARMTQQHNADRYEQKSDR